VSPLVVDVISDIHFGYGSESPDAVSSYVHYANASPPDIQVWLGDVVELASASSHGGDPEPPTLQDDLDASRAGIQTIVDATPDVERRVWVPGNHEDRFRRRIIDRVPEMESALPSLEELLGVAEHFETPGKVFVLGATLFTHGWVNSRHHHAKMLDHFPDVNVVYGHHHTARTAWSQRRTFKEPKPLDPIVSTRRERFALANPCLRDLSPSWLRSPSTWCNGFSRLLLWGDDLQHCQPHVHIMRGPERSFAADGHVWTSKGPL